MFGEQFDILRELKQIREHRRCSFDETDDDYRTYHNLEDLIYIVGLSGYENHFPHQKSLGFRFRISLARALAVNPEIILIDESFKLMEPVTKTEILELIISISTGLNKTILITSTSISDAAIVSDKVLLMKKNPGSIFKEIQIEKDQSQKGIIFSENFTKIKDLIENAFRKENIVNTLDISI